MDLWYTVPMRRVCVFCGSSLGRGPAYAEAAKRLARALTRRNIDLVYGASGVGVMGALADAVLGLGGKVVGVIPKQLMEREKFHKNLTEMRVVGSMHERKALMGELSEGFIALPGGLGTLEEFFEVLTWNQLGIHDKPCGLLNVNGYYDSLIQLLDRSVEEHFVSAGDRAAMLVGGISLLTGDGNGAMHQLSSSARGRIPI